MLVTKGTANQSITIRIVDSTDGTPETGVVWNTSGIDMQYRREGAVSTAITEATLAALTTAHTDGGFLHIGNGYYRLDVPDAAFATGVDGVLIHGTVTGMVVIGVYVQLTDIDPFDAVRGGMTALPNANADAAGGIPISDAGALDLDTLLGYLTAAVATASALTTAQNDLDIITGAAGAVLDSTATSAQLVDDIWDEVIPGAHVTNNTSGALLNDTATKYIKGTVDDVTGATTTSFLTNLEATYTSDDFFSNQPLRFATGANAGQAKIVLNYNGTTGLITVDEAFDVAPSLNDKFEIDVTHVHPVSQIADAVWDEILTGATHNIATSAGRRLRGIQEFQGYEGGAIWVDTLNGTAGTVDYENGTVENPVDTFADALTLAASLGFTRFSIVNGSTITLAATLNNSVLVGDRWTLALGGQDVGGSHFGGANVSGTATGTEAHYVDCNVGTVTLSNAHLENCRLSGTITLSATGDYHIADSHSGIAGSGTPVIDMGAAVLNTNLNIRRYSGGIEIQNLNAAGTDNFSIEGVGQIIYAASSSGTVNQRGDWKVTNTGGVGIAADDNTTNVATILTDTADMQPKLGTPAGADMSADIASIKTDTASILVDTGTSGVIVATNNDKTGYTIATGGIAAAAFAAGAIDSAATSADFVDDILDEVCETQGNYTLRQIASLTLSVLAGVTSGGGATLETPNGLATRVVATIDGSNNRTAMTLTP